MLRATILRRPYRNHEYYSTSGTELSKSKQETIDSQVKGDLDMSRSNSQTKYGRGNSLYLQRTSQQQYSRLGCRQNRGEKVQLR